MSESIEPTVSVHGELDGVDVKRFTLTSSGGMTVQVSELGAQLISVTLPDGSGSPVELTLGHADFAGWCSNEAYLGATCGRFGNRIADGRFQLEGVDYELARNNAPGGIPCHLHGGEQGFNRKLWVGTPLSGPGRQGVCFRYTSPDGEEGYPGTLDVRVTYWLSDDQELVWSAEATTDKATPVNLVNHTYWNLSGNLDAEITDHEIQIHADRFLPTTPGMIPTGEMREVAGTPMDLREPVRIGEGIDADYEPLQIAGGFDHCWVLQGDAGTLRPAASVVHPSSGRRMDLWTDAPGVQFYSGNFLDGSVNGHEGHCFPRRSGLCLETEGFPDAPNQAAFPSSILSPGELYRHSMQFRFG